MHRLVRRLIVSPRVRRAALGLAVPAAAPAAQLGEGVFRTTLVARAAAESPAQTAALYPPGVKGAPRPPNDPIDGLAPLCRLEIAPGSAAPAGPPAPPLDRP